MKFLFLLIMGLSLTINPTEPTLEDFVFTQELLPKNCSFKEVTEGARLPCKATTNPYVSNDPAFVNCFAGMMLRDEALTQKVKKALFSVYMDTNEVGVFGLEADSEESALQIVAHLEDKAPNDEGSSLLQSGPIVILLWQDRGKTEAYETLKSLIEKQMEK
ncbi:MAG: hypothetical protein KTR22_00075 [Flavobacteriaceae bacterium]|nr:hypothetical protein [Flavobacteriaceae bacterium]